MMILTGGRMSDDSSNVVVPAEVIRRSTRIRLMSWYKIGNGVLKQFLADLVIALLTDHCILCLRRICPAWWRGKCALAMDVFNGIR